MTVDELLSRITAAELSEWMAYNSISPVGMARADQRAALIACTLANIHRGKNQQPQKIRDFMLYPEPKPKQSLASMQASMQRFAKMNELAQQQRKGGLGG